MKNKYFIEKFDYSNLLLRVGFSLYCSMAILVVSCIASIVLVFVIVNEEFSESVGIYILIGIILLQFIFVASLFFEGDRMHTLNKKVYVSMEKLKTKKGAK